MAVFLNAKLMLHALFCVTIDTVSNILLNDKL